MEIFDILFLIYLVLALYSIHKAYNTLNKKKSKLKIVCSEVIELEKLNKS